MKKPDLIIGYEGNGSPVSAACSSCGEWMSAGSKVPNTKATLGNFAEEFNVHLRLSHEPPIAGRITRSS